MSAPQCIPVQVSLLQFYIEIMQGDEVVETKKKKNEKEEMKSNSSPAGRPLLLLSKQTKPQ